MMTADEEQGVAVVQQEVVATSNVVVSQQPISTADDVVPNNNLDPLIVLILNFFFPGLGHVVLGQMGKGIAYIVIYIVGANIIAFLSFIIIGFCLLPVIILWWVFIMLDGYNIAQRVKEGRVVKKGECTNGWAKFGVSVFEKSEVFVQ